MCRTLHTSPVLISGDLNAARGCNARHMARMAQQCALTVSAPSHPTFQNSRMQQSHTDYFALSHDLSLVTAYPVVSPMSYTPSDHFPIACVVHMGDCEVRRSLPDFLYSDVCNFRWCDDKAALLCDHIASKLHPHEDDQGRVILPGTSLDEAHQWLTSILHDAGAAHGLLTRYSDPPPAGGCTPRRFPLSKEARRVKACILALTRAGAPQAQHLVRTLRRQFKRHVRWAKLRRAWFRGRLFADRLRQEPRRFWKPWRRRAQSLIQASQVHLSRWRDHYQRLFTALSSTTSHCPSWYQRWAGSTATRLQAALTPSLPNFWPYGFVPGDPRWL